MKRRWIDLQGPGSRGRRRRSVLREHRSIPSTGERRITTGGFRCRKGRGSLTTELRGCHRRRYRVLHRRYRDEITSWREITNPIDAAIVGQRNRPSGSLPYAADEDLRV